jgi:hypothetical protein
MIRLDWKAYWSAFCQLHGGNPVAFEGRWLFQDGWMYAKKDYQGPEWEAPKEKARLEYLIRSYWRLRLETVLASKRDIEINLRNLKLTQKDRSAPLVQVVKYKSDDGKLLSRAGPIDLRALEERVQWLEQDAQQCRDKLKEVGNAKVASTVR